MKNLRLKVAVLFLMICGLFGSVSAQMAAAKMVPPNVKREVTIKASEQVVWDLIASLENVEKYASGLVKKSVADGQGLDAVREMEMLDGTTRLETVLIFAPQGRKICFIPFEDYLPTTHCAIHYNITPMGPNKCKLSIAGYLDAKKGASKSKIIKQLGKEFSIITKGIKAYLEAK